ncbi:uncharacterized protein LOC141851301 [Brevipalpus obovatus]|uniref:uncharacterized protein LOC141851301 n=1 Tax=Brevipalpus obovatus TaxID=246614 RepID=UPI003D9F0E1E
MSGSESIVSIFKMASCVRQSIIVLFVDRCFHKLTDNGSPIGSVSTDHSGSSDDKDRLPMADNSGPDSQPDYSNDGDKSSGIYEEDRSNYHNPPSLDQPNYGYGEDVFPVDLFRTTHRPNYGTRRSGNTEHHTSNHHHDDISPVLNGNRVEDGESPNYEDRPTIKPISNKKANGRRYSDVRIRKQAPLYPRPQSNPFDPTGLGGGGGGGPGLGPSLGPNIGAEFIPGFQDPTLGGGRGPVFPFFDSNPFLGPGPNEHGPNGEHQPPSINGPNSDNGAFQRRRLAMNSIHNNNDNSLGYGYPPYNYYRGEDEAATKWPKIFKFTDGRVNLSDFERNKKLGKVKFTKKDAFDDVRRDSFLILHGGAYNY